MKDNNELNEIKKSLKKLEGNYTKTKKQLGITLVALVITIIVLLILAGITVAQLSGSGLFDNVKLAKQKYKDSQDLEENILSQYENASLNGIVSTRDGESNPIGTVIAFMGATAPTNYLPCDGRVLNVSEYGKLFDVLKTADHTGWATADWSTTFSLPNLQGEFLRGTGNNADTTQGNGGNIGEHQKGTEDLNVVGNTANTNLKVSRVASGVINYDKLRIQNIHTLYISGSDSGYNDGYSYTARPTNTSVLYCIKAK